MEAFIWEPVYRQCLSFERVQLPTESKVKKVGCVGTNAKTEKLYKLPCQLYVIKFICSDVNRWMLPQMELMQFAFSRQDMHHFSVIPTFFPFFFQFPKKMKMLISVGVFFLFFFHPPLFTPNSPTPRNQYGKQWGHWNCIDHSQISLELQHIFTGENPLWVKAEQRWTYTS